MFNQLDSYIASLNPTCWLNSQHVNGYGVTQPNEDQDIITWVNLTGDINYNLVYKNPFLSYSVKYETEFANTTPPKFRRYRFNNLPAIDFNTSMMWFNNWQNTLEINKEYTIIRIAKDNIGAKYDLDFGNASNKYGAIMRYNGYSSSDNNDRTGFTDLDNNQRFLSVKTGNIRNKGITTYILQYKEGQRETWGTCWKDTTNYLKEVSINITRPRMLNDSIMPMMTNVGPSIGGCWNRGFNAPFNVGGAEVDALLYYELIYLERYITDSEILRVQSYIKTKYNI